MKTMKKHIKKAVRAVARAAKRVKRAVKRAVHKTKEAARAVARKVKAAARKAKAVTGPAISRAWTKVARTWGRTLKPFLKSWGTAFVGITWLTSLTFMPLPTIAATGVAGLGLLAASKGIERLEMSESRIAKMAMRTINLGIQTARVLFYAAAGAMVALTAAVSLPVLLLYVTDLAWTHFVVARRTRKVAEIPTASTIKLKARTKRSKAVEEAIVVEPEPVVVDEVLSARRKALRAVGAEEMFDMPACDACGTVEEGLRAKSHRRTDDAKPEAWLCSECYDAECEDDALRFTGVSLAQRSVEFRLNEEGLKTTTAYARSLTEDAVVWGGSPPDRDRDATTWWRDKAGREFGRAWSGFVAGEVVANVLFDYRRGTYRILVNGKPPRNVGAQRDLGAAIRLASELWNNEKLNIEHETETAPAATVLVPAMAV